jgi:pimeloyl-ACP methyl ester carboxylesterase
MKDLSGLPQEVFARSFDGGARTVLALHCTLGHSGAWRGLAALIADQATVHAFDMLSHGRSPDWDGQGDVHDRITEIAEQFLEDGMDLVGHSFGATVALRLTCKHPEKVRSLTLFEPVFFAIAAQDRPDLIAAQDAEFKPISDAIKAGDLETAARLFNREWGGGLVRWDDMPEQMKTAMVRGIPYVTESHAVLYDDAAGMLEPGVLDRLDMPVLLVRGADTQDVIAAVNDGLARRLPNARSKIVARAGHMVPITNPKQCAELMRPLLADS